MVTSKANKQAAAGRKLVVVQGFVTGNRTSGGKRSPATAARRDSFSKGAGPALKKESFAKNKLVTAEHNMPVVDRGSARR
jgi:hypothetical protein